MEYAQVEKKIIIIIIITIIIKVQLAFLQSAKWRWLFNYPCMTCYVKKPITFENFHVSSTRVGKLDWFTYRFDVVLQGMIEVVTSYQNFFHSRRIDFKIVLKLINPNKRNWNIVAPTMLGIVAFVLAMVCKRMQQLPTSLGPAVTSWKEYNP